MRNLEHYKNQLWSAAEEAFLDTPEHNPGMQQLYNEFIAAPSKREKTIAVLKLVRSIMPENWVDKERLKPYFIEPGKVPYAAEHYTFKDKIGAGGQADVFLLESKDPELPSYALKSSKLEEDDSTVALVKSASGLKKALESIYEAYKEIPEVFPREHIFISNNPSLHRYPKTIVRIQRFFAHNFEDLFSFTPEQILAIAQEEPAFREQLQIFIRVTLDLKDNHDKVTDLNGSHNLNIVETENGHNLLFLDPYYTGASTDLTNKHLAMLRGLQEKLGS